MTQETITRARPEHCGGEAPRPGGQDGTSPAREVTRAVVMNHPHWACTAGTADKAADLIACLRAAGRLTWQQARNAITTAATAEEAWRAAALSRQPHPLTLQDTGPITDDVTKALRRAGITVLDDKEQPAVTETAAAAPAEGWGVIRPGDRRAHYYRDGTSLCRRIGFYNGSLDPDTGQSPDDCAACRKALGKEAAARAAAHDVAAKSEPTSPERTGAEDPAGETPR